MPVVLDVDTGVDDALALLLAVRHQALDLRAVSCVAGNAPVDQVVANTLKALDAADAPDVPVARGADRPTRGKVPASTRSLHGADGMADLGLPASSREPIADDAVELLRTAIAGSSRPVTLVLLAPMTNVALLLRRHPDIVGGIERIVVMGDPERGDFNVGHDPEAAATVLDRGLPVTTYGLSVFHAVTVPTADARRLAASVDPGARMAGRLLGHQARRFGPDQATLGDAGALAAVVDPAGLTTTRRGDQVDVAVSVDGARYRRLFLDALLTARPGRQ